MASKKMKVAANEETMLDLVIPPIETKTFNVKLVGDSSLIVHKWSEKAMKMILDKQTKKAGTGKEAKDPWADYCDSMYWLTEKPTNPTEDDIAEAKFGFPAKAFKACAIDAGFQQGIIPKKTTARGAFHILGEMVEIEGQPRIREDMVRIAMGTADIRYRGEYPEWSVVLTIRYNPRAMSAEQIINLLNFGGFSNGVGEWRPEKNGDHGTFHVAVMGE
ncbi:MAG: hypothetical protein IJ089_02555 [Clostridia bacterium]|nr:hypothetical protein [Clostridia bacterium]